MKSLSHTYFSSVAHFVAFESSAVTFLAFNNNGVVLVAADVKGQKLHVFHMGMSVL